MTDLAKEMTIQYNCLDGLLVSNPEIMNVGTGVFWSDVIFNVLKIRDINLLTKIHIGKAMFFQ